jgi:general secretion pathway protein F
MSVPAIDDLTFRYTAVDKAGRQVRDVIRARDEKGAARALAAEGLTPLSLSEEKTAIARSKDRDLNFAERVSVLQQIALMVEAGVGLLEAMQTVAGGVVPIKGRAALDQVIASLKRGESFAHSLETHAPGYPFYVYAMTRVGEATGQLGQVLAEAADQMAYEHRLRRDFTNSLTYPAFLMFAGIASVSFLLIRVVPVFAQMVGDRTDLPLISRLVFQAGAFAQQNYPYVGIGLGIAVVALIGGLANAGVRRSIYDFAHGLPLIGGLLKAREITSWARLIGFSLRNGVLLLDAAALARQGAPEGAFRQNLDHFERDLKAGVDVDVSLARHTRLEPMDLSLLRAGQKSGQLPKMFLYVADRYDVILKDRLKRVTSLIEPVTIGIVAVFVAVLAVSIMLSLTSVYESIS